jgi:hypothetical protein
MTKNLLPVKRREVFLYVLIEFFDASVIVPTCLRQAKCGRQASLHGYIIP